jgi:hypothetical protein
MKSQVRRIAGCSAIGYNVPVKRPCTIWTARSARVALGRPLCVWEVVGWKNRSQPSMSN